jgi:hypothetical protein
MGDRLGTLGAVGITFVFIGKGYVFKEIKDSVSSMYVLHFGHSNIFFK